MKQLTLLGATGSIGQQTLAVLALHPKRYQVFAVSAATQVQKLLQVIEAVTPKIAVMVDAMAAKALQKEVEDRKLSTIVLSGTESLIEIASCAEVDIVVAGIMGAAGLASTLTAVQAGKRVLLANKEPLVMAGHLFVAAAHSSGAELLPVDSEHNALFQCLPTTHRLGERDAGVQSITLTASGGALRDVPMKALSQVTPEQALRHPNWSMGAKITVDSATMMNKGLEVIEAYHLFGLPSSAIHVVLHPQSLVHAWTSYEDGSLLAHWGQADMRVPIAHALAWPERIHSGVAALDVLQIQQLDFLPLDKARYPCFELALHALEAGGAVPIALNAANEVLVAAFLQKKIKFTDIYRYLCQVLEHCTLQTSDDLETILDVDAQARLQTTSLLAQ